MGGGMSKKVRDRVYACKKAGGKDLNLEDCDLLKFPDKLLSVKSLVKLNLSHNSIPSVPSDFSKLSRLVHVNLSYNEVEVLPSSLAKLKSLEELDVAFNVLAVLPEALVRLKGLKQLHAGGNAISTLPAGLAGLASLHVLSLTSSRLQQVPAGCFEPAALRVLDLSQNELSALPEAVTRLSHLEELDLSNNRLPELPSFINQLPSLVVLRLHHNQLQELPPSIEGCVKLRVLDCSNNIMPSLEGVSLAEMHQMEELRFASNRLKTFDVGIGHMRSLRVLDLEYNELSKLTREVGWLGASLRELLLQNNKLQTLPGEVSFLNPTVKLTLERNPLLDPFSMLLGNKKTVEQIKPYCQTYVRAFPENCLATGEAVLQSAAGTPARFLIEAHDFEGKPRVNGKDTFTATFVEELAAGAAEEESTVVHGIVKDLQDGTYQVAWNNRKAGYFLLSVKNDRDHVRNSPFMHRVLPGPTTPANCRIEGLLGVPLAAAELLRFTIVAQDQFNNRQVLDNEPFVVSITGGNTPVPLITDLHNGSYEVQWTPAWPGQYVVEVGFSGFHLAGSPFQVTVGPPKDFAAAAPPM